MSHGISFEVEGWPPIKNEAKSLLAAAHSQVAQVRALLEAADAAVISVGWERVGDLIALELVVRSPVRPPGDATNYLGGVGDVLQAKNQGMVDLGHLGELSDVALYINDRQISRIAYWEETAERTSYVVRISTLDTADTRARATA